MLSKCPSFAAGALDPRVQLRRDLLLAVRKGPFAWARRVLQRGEVQGCVIDPSAWALPNPSSAACPQSVRPPSVRPSSVRLSARPSVRSFAPSDFSTARQTAPQADRQPAVRQTRPPARPPAVPSDTPTQDDLFPQDPQAGSLKEHIGFHPQILMRLAMNTRHIGPLWKNLWRAMFAGGDEVLLLEIVDHNGSRQAPAPPANPHPLSRARVAP